MDKEPKPRQYLVDAEQLKDMMKYLMTRPYGEVFSLMNQISQLKPFNPQGDKDVGKK
ncbi:MAG: hypothetical protein CM15mV108_130 [uncultured marine virus]|jgi:hypothetical protein|nr:MAG: hypothetical protein CM15mV108_130 [uncultured marine virus]|tara:strand:+ start:85 stop:255 length:171 start_codon:yes stop_codon:yes gene_type:complete